MKIKHGRRQGLLGSAAVLVVLAGCTASFPAKHVKLSEADALKQPGIYYALPKTVFDLRVPVEYTSYQGGELREVERCWLEYRSGLPAADKACDVSALPPKLELKPGRVEPRAVPDPRHVYVVEPATWWWYSMSHEFANDSGGFLRSSESKASNQAAEVTLAVVKAVLPVVASGGLAVTGTQKSALLTATDKVMALPNDQKTGLLQGDVRKNVQSFLEGEDKKLKLSDPQLQAIALALKQYEALMPAERSLLDACRKVPLDDAWDSTSTAAEASLQLTVDRVVEATEGKPGLSALSRLSVECLVGLIGHRQQQVLAAEKALRDQLRGHNGRANAPDYSRLIAETEERHVASLRARLAALRQGLRIDGVEKKTAFEITAVDPFEPAGDGKAPGPQAAWRPSEDRARIVSWPRGPESPEIRAAVEQLRGAGHLVRRASATEAMGKTSRCLDKPDDAGCATADTSIGYRYRLPVRGRIELAWLSLNVKEYCSANLQHCKLPNGAGDAACSSNEIAKCIIKEPEKAMSQDQHYSETVLAEAIVPVAQFGPIVALPASFSGKNVNVSLTLTPHGSMSNIKLGQEARDASGLTGVLDAVTAEKTKRDEAQKEAAKAAASAPLDALQQTNSLLEAQIKQRQLQECLNQWKPGEPKPAGC